MSETRVPHSSQVDSPATKLGIADGEFNVVRTSGDVETGWDVLRLNEVANDLGEVATSVVISKVRDDEILTKTVAKEDLLEWQTDNLNSKKDNALDDLANFLGNIKSESPKDDAGNFELSTEKQLKMKNLLEGLGIVDAEPSEEDIASGIKRAKEIVDSGRVVEELNKNPFLDNFDRLIRGARGTRLVFSDDKLLYVDSSKIEGAGSFESWAGRGSHYSMFMRKDGMGDKDYVKSDGTSVVGRSSDVIADYATRDTALPPLDFLALNIALTDKGPIVHGTTSNHRIAAAKLRNEPLGFNSVTFYDLRSKKGE